MSELFEQITDTHTKFKKQTENEAMIFDTLRRNLSKEHKDLVLQLIDEKDLLLERSSRKYFKTGFRKGFKLAMDIFKLSD